ncbi:MAG: COX15/CtaA family protein [Prochlorococcaceae cyanobacterium ETNP14_MAG_4]|nr:COX15/CtaA family protein [Prochlorococcaceae cyanobacterium ETNP14_MAG_4]
MMYLSRVRRRLAQLAAHLVVALIALVVIGGATRVMEAGLACPDWPLCYGSLLPGRQMNVQVFLEWFHRLDAFVVGVALLVQLGAVLFWRSQLPGWLPWFCAGLVALVLLQGALGALTVLQLLPSGVVTAHLALALTLVAALSGLSQRLLSSSDMASPLWWRLMGGASLLAVTGQCLLGGRMATAWAAQRCLHGGEACQWLQLHRISATPVAVCLLIFVCTALLVGGWPRRQWPFLISVLALVVTQIGLGFLTLQLGFSQPVVTVGHQLVAALLVALLAALSFRSPEGSNLSLSAVGDSSSMEPCHG